MDTMSRPVGIIKLVYKEYSMVGKPIIGYVAVDENGKPPQTTIGRSYPARTKPITIYKYEKDARQITGYYVPVYMEDVNEWL